MYERRKSLHIFATSVRKAEAFFANDDANLISQEGPIDDRSAIEDCPCLGSVQRHPGHVSHSFQRLRRYQHPANAFAHEQPMLDCSYRAHFARVIQGWITLQLPLHLSPWHRSRVQNCFMERRMPKFGQSTLCMKALAATPANHAS